MGIYQSCMGGDSDSLDNIFKAIPKRSISFKGEDVNATIRTLSFKDSVASISKKNGSGMILLEGSLSFKGTQTDQVEVQTTFSITNTSFEKEDCSESSSFDSSVSSKKSLSDPDSPKHEAALKLQKVYKSFRTRRQLADCAVLVEQRWSKLLDFAMLKHSSVSFFNVDKPESVISRWSRARTRVAKVGKGLSNNAKAQKLALQHWLEAIDPRHRYGHNLHLYYVSWLHCESRQPFFYWLDVGDGKEVNLERCSRSKLQQQCIKYLCPEEREAYEIIIENGKFVYKQSGRVLDTSEVQDGLKWIFVLSTTKALYVGQKVKGKFQHSSFLAGGATSSAGRLVIEKGILKAVWPHSGHYRPTEENFQDFVNFLEENNVDLTDVKKDPTDEDEFSSAIRTTSFRTNSSQLFSFRDKMTCKNETVENKQAFECDDENNSSESELQQLDEESLKGQSTSHEDLFRGSDEESDDDNKTVITDATKATEGPDYIFQKRNLFEEEQYDTEEPTIKRELILHRMNSGTRTRSLRLGKQLSGKWSSGVGARISCVRDYPSELQFRALEEVCLSPRTLGNSKLQS